MLNTSDDLYSTTGKFIIIMAREANRLLLSLQRTTISAGFDAETSEIVYSLHLRNRKPKRNPRKRRDSPRHFYIMYNKRLTMRHGHG